MRKIKTLFLILLLTVAIFEWNINLPFVENETHNEIEAAENEKVTDVVCGMEIDKDSAKVVNVEGKNFYFCSDNCKAKFEENPGKATCMCFVGLKEGDEQCDCNHCSGKGGKCDCAEHGGHGEHAGHEHGHGDHKDEHSDHGDASSKHGDEHSGHEH